MRTDFSLQATGFLMLLLGFIGGCASLEETREETPPPPPPPAVKPADPPMTFHTRTDTVLSATPSGRTEPMVEHRDPEIRYMVQVGSFKDASNASRVQSATRDRLKMPVLNDFNTVTDLYQIRIGFFETREAASAFRDKLIRDYPQDYRDSWVVQLMR